MSAKVQWSIPCHHCQNRNYGGYVKFHRAAGLKKTIKCQKCATPARFIQRTIWKLKNFINRIIL